MKTILKTLSFVVLMTPALAQTESDSYKTVAEQFEKNYNAANNEAVFADFSSEMQNALPLTKTADFFNGLRLQAGRITKREFIKYENTYAVYKTEFERAVFAVLISIDGNLKINGLLIKPFVDTNHPKPERNTTRLMLPFKDEWTVFWGGDTKELNYHVANQAQKNAFDLIITDTQGKSYRTNGQANEDYYAFGKELYAPCNAEVVLVVDGIKDNQPGRLNPIYVPGNTVILKTANNEYLLFAHFKRHSIRLKEGQRVEQGDLLGLCGNSGNSSEPHLHYHMQNVEDMNEATGIKSFFDSLLVNGALKRDYSPVKGEKIKPANYVP